MSLPKPYYDRHGVRLYLGDAYELLGEMRADRRRKPFDGLVTDPPYSSAGLSAPERQAPVSSKYTQQGSKKFAGVNFPGDNKDQRSQLAWMSL